MLKKNQIDFDWAFCKLLSFEYQEIEQFINELYPEVNDNAQFINEFNIALHHWQFSNLKNLVIKVHDIINDFPVGTSTNQKIIYLSKIFTDYEESLKAKHNLEVDEFDIDISLFHKLLPLFFGLNLKKANGALFKRAKIRELAFKSFQKALKDAGSNLRNVKAIYNKEAKRKNYIIIAGPFDKEFDLAEIRFNAGNNQYISPDDLESLELNKNEKNMLVKIHILKQSILDRKVLKPGAIAKTRRAQAENLIDLGKAEFVDSDEIKLKQTEMSDGDNLSSWRKSKGPFSDNINVNYNSSETFFKYIQAWIIASVSFGLISRIADFMIAEATLNETLNQSDIITSNYWLILPPIQALIWLAIFIFVYLNFESLKISKTLPFIWGFGTVGVLLSIAFTNRMLNMVEVELPIVFVLSSLISFGLAFFLFGRYFETKYPNRY